MFTNTEDEDEDEPPTKSENVNVIEVEIGKRELDDRPTKALRIVDEEGKCPVLPAILDGRFFSVPQKFGSHANDIDKIGAKCQLCGKIVKGSKTSTGNFLSHFKVSLRIKSAVWNRLLM